MKRESLSDDLQVEKLGRHILIHGDASSDGVKNLLQSMSIQLVINDPPYGMNLNTKYSSMHFEKTDSAKKFLRTTGVTMPKDYKPVIGDDKPFKMSEFDYLDAPEQLWFGADYYRKELPEGGAFLVWDKRTTESMDRMFGSCFELIWSKKPHKRDIIRCVWAGLYGTQYEDIKKRIHPTQKPTRLLARLIDKFSNEGDTVADMFGGSGSTLIACEMTGRSCVTCEIDEHYCDVIRKRYWQFVNNAKI